MSLPLEGIRVLDFGRFVAGPACAALLADFGADVIRVERPEGGEDRGVMAPSPDIDGMLYRVNNRNKRGIALDTASAEGRTVLARLLATTDVVVANMPSATLKKMGLDYESLTTIREDIVLTTINTFGEQGPLKDRVGFDGVAQAMSGAIAITGSAEMPMRSQVTFTDYATGFAAAFGTVAALYERLRTGKGQHVQGSLIGTALAMTNATIMEDIALNRDRPRSENRSTVAAPSDVYRTIDGRIVVQVVGDFIFDRWLKLVGALELKGDPRFADDAARGLHGHIISEIMQRWCASRSTERALAELEAARVPGGPVLTPREAYASEELRGQGFFNDNAPAGVTDLWMADCLLRSSRHKFDLKRNAPRIGEHSIEIFSEFDLK